MATPVEAAILGFLLKTLAKKVTEAAVKQALGVDIGGASLGAWTDQVTLGLLTGKGITPGPTVEQQIEIAFARLEAQIIVIRRDLALLRSEVDHFQWTVHGLLHEAREEALWQIMLHAEISTDSRYERLTALGKSQASLEVRRKQGLQLADDILTGTVAADVETTRLAIMGRDVNVGGERVRGLLEIWKEQALREADLGWRGSRLGEIFNLLREKFLRALLIQARGARLMIEAHEARHRDDPTQKSGASYYAETFYPILAEETICFRDVIESLAVNLLPLPEVPLAPLNVPAEIGAMLGGLDVFVAKTLNSGVQSGCWGRVFVPGTRWIRRTPGETLNARVNIRAQESDVVSNGTVAIRSIAYTPYEAHNGVRLHSGYQLSVGGEQRDMHAMLLAHFQPAEALPPKLTAPNPSNLVNMRILDDSGALLAATEGIVVPIDANGEGAVKVPFGTFAMAFTAGAEIRAIDGR